MKGLCGAQGENKTPSSREDRKSSLSASPALPLLTEPLTACPAPGLCRTAQERPPERPLPPARRFVTKPGARDLALASSRPASGGLPPRQRALIPPPDPPNSSALRPGAGRPAGEVAPSPSLLCQLPPPRATLAFLAVPPSLSLLPHTTTFPLQALPPPLYWLRPGAGSGGCGELCGRRPRAAPCRSRRFQSVAGRAGAPGPSWRRLWESLLKNGGKCQASRGPGRGNPQSAEQHQGQRDGRGRSRGGRRSSSSPAAPGEDAVEQVDVPWRNAGPWEGPQAAAGKQQEEERAAEKSG